MYLFEHKLLKTNKPVKCQDIPELFQENVSNQKKADYIESAL